MPLLTPETFLLGAAYWRTQDPETLIDGIYDLTEDPRQPAHVAEMYPHLEHLDAVVLLSPLTSSMHQRPVPAFRKPYYDAVVVELARRGRDPKSIAALLTGLADMENREL